MKKIKRKQMNLVGKSKYNFDSSLEKKIYAYLCFEKIKRNSLDDKLKFDYYYQWKGYIIDKYNNFDTVTLGEFSRYLNLRRNNIKFDYNYWNVCIPVVLTLVVNVIYNLVVKSDFIKELYEIDLNGMDTRAAIIVIGIEGIIAVLFLFSVVIVPFIGTIISLFNPLRNSINEKNFYEDYKEVIDGIIEKRKDECGL